MGSDPQVTGAQPTDRSEDHTVRATSPKVTPADGRAFHILCGSGRSFLWPPARPGDGRSSRCSSFPHGSEGRASSKPSPMSTVNEGTNPARQSLSPLLS